MIDASLSEAEADARIAAVAWHRFQMPAYHVVRDDGQGVSLVNIGVGPANAKNITDHIAVLRPHCWLMVGHCAGLRQSQLIGDYVLAHAYLRQDHILDDAVPLDMPIPALAEVQVALQEAVARVTGDRGEALKRRLRTGTVVTNDDRNWELRWTQERRRINLSRAIAVDMESGTIATQGFRMRVPYGTLLCVSDKPLHGEIKLPGAANAFYERAIGEHLQIGIAALELLQEPARHAAFAQIAQLRRAAVPLTPISVSTGTIEATSNSAIAILNGRTKRGLLRTRRIAVPNSTQAAMQGIVTSPKTSATTMTERV